MVNATHAKQAEEVREISAITYGFMASKALFVAVEFDLLTRIARGADLLPALVQATGIAENRLVTLLTALKSLGLITERDGRFTNAPATARYLVAGAPGDFRDYVNLVNGAFGYESFRHLGTALRGERIFPDKGFLSGVRVFASIISTRSSSAFSTTRMRATRAYGEVYVTYSFIGTSTRSTAIELRACAHE